MVDPDRPDRIVDTSPGVEPRPFSTSVDPAWIDYNGHVNDAAYAAISGTANEELCIDIGISADYRAQTGRALYSAQLTIRYLHEIAPEDRIDVFRTVTGLGRKSLVVRSEFRVGDRPAAATEHVYVLVDSTVGSSVAFNGAERARIEHLVGRTF